RVRDDVLAPFVLEHGCRCVHAGARLELPELRAVARIERRQAAVVAADEYEPAAGRDGAAVARLRPVLLPHELVRAHVERGEDAERMQVKAAEAAADEARAFGRTLGADVGRDVRPRSIGGAYVEISGLGVVRARRPVRAAGDAGLHDHRRIRPERREDAAAVHERDALGGDRHRLRDERIADGVGLGRRSRLSGLLRHRSLLDADERRAVGAVEDVDPAGLARLREALAHHAVDFDVEQHDGARAVVVPDIVMHLLEVPAVFAGLRIDGDDRRGEEVVAGADRAVVVGTGIAGREVQQAELRVDRRRLPDRRSAVLPDLVVLRPRVVADLAGAGDRVERPFELAGRGVESLDSPADFSLAAGEAREHETVVIERRARNRVALLPALGLHGPDDFAAGLLERDELAVELPDEDLAVAEADAAAGPAAAHGVVGGIELGAILPENLARLDVEREDVVGAGHDVDDALVNDRLRFARVLRTDARAAQPRAPNALQVRDVVPVDLRQRRVAAVVPVAAVRRPAVAGRLDERVAREPRCRLDRDLGVRADRGQRCGERED